MLCTPRVIPSFITFHDEGEAIRFFGPLTQAVTFHGDELFDGLAECMNTKVNENQIGDIASLDKTVLIGLIREFNITAARTGNLNMNLGRKKRRACIWK